MPKNEKVVLFPKLKTTLENESLRLLQNKNYTEALSMLNQLIHYDIQSHEIIIGKLICLMELGRYTEAQDECEKVLSKKNKHYYDYLHIYLTILFQTNQYEQLMKIVDHELDYKHVPTIIRDQFKQLYSLSEAMEKELNIEKSVKYTKQLKEAIAHQQYTEQWRTIERLRKINAEPTNEMITLLKDEDIHPVVKTALFQWLQERNISEAVSVYKMGYEDHIKPTTVPTIESHVAMKQILLIISELEQKNPSLHQMLEQLLFRYAYVYYPFLPSSEDAIHISEALKVVGEEYLNIKGMANEDSRSERKEYVQAIKTGNLLYSSVLVE